MSHDLAKRQVFISWASQPSGEIAILLKDWLLSLMDGLHVWQSDVDARLGERWSESLQVALTSTDYALLCVTPQNVDSPWLALEAGAAAMGRQVPTVPLLFGMGVADLPSHLGFLQAAEATHENLARLGREVHNKLRPMTTVEALEQRLSSQTDALLVGATRLLVQKGAAPSTRSIRSNRALANYKHLVADVQAAPEVLWPSGGYRFHVFSVGERGTHLTSDLIREVKSGLVELVKGIAAQVDRIVTVVPGGHPWALMVGETLGLPVEILREEGSGIHDERIVRQRSLLYERSLYFRDHRQNKARVLFLDDVVSSGNTSALAIAELRKSGLEVVAAVAIVFKGEGYRDVVDTTGVAHYGLIEVGEDYVRAAPRPSPQ